MEYTKTQLKARAKKIAEQLDNLKMELEELQSDLETESADIEPYENKYELTPQQEERQEWLDNAAYEVGYAADNIQEALDNLEALEF